MNAIPVMLQWPTQFACYQCEREMSNIILQIDKAFCNNALTSAAKTFDKSKAASAALFSPHLTQRSQVQRTYGPEYPSFARVIIYELGAEKQFFCRCWDCCIRVSRMSTKFCLPR